jgi:hypothetical protein
LLTVKRFHTHFSFPLPAPPPPPPPSLFLIFNYFFEKEMLSVLVQLADLTGELMRLAIGRISEGELEFAEKICRFVRDIYRELTLLVPHMDDSYDMKTKMDTMLQSVMKIENGILLTIFLPIVVSLTNNISYKCLYSSSRVLLMDMA